MTVPTSLEARAVAEGLTGKQVAWLVAYLGPAELDSTAAARLAGYADPYSAGHANRRHYVIRGLIAAWVPETAMSPGETIARIELIARTSESEATRLRALELLARTQALFVERKEVRVEHVDFVLDVGGDLEPEDADFREIKP